MIKIAENIMCLVRSVLNGAPDGFLKKVSGVIHVGANAGQERHLYAQHGLRVLWIEPAPEIFQRLKENIEKFPLQRAVECLVTDCDNKEYPFHITSNEGASSSILELALHRKLWPQVDCVETIALRSKTLVALLKDEQFEASAYDALVLDTQGSEYLVLKGAVTILKNFTYIKVEVPDFESYKDCAQIKDLGSFMDMHGFKELSRHCFEKRRNVGKYYDVLYRRRD